MSKFRTQLRPILALMLIISISKGVQFQDPPVNLSFNFPRPDVGPYNVFYPYITRLMDAAWQSVNDNIVREYQLSFTYINDFNNQTMTEQILTNILNNDVAYFLPCCIGYGNLMLDVMTQEAKTGPLIAPLDIDDQLRGVEQYRHVINLLASETEEVATIISYLTVDLQLSRIAYYGPNGTAAITVNNTLAILGRRLVLYLEYIDTVEPEHVSEMVAIAPEAIILTTDAAVTISYVSQLRTFAATNNTIIIIPSATGTTGALNFVLTTDETTRNVFAIASTPTWTNNSIPGTLIDLLTQDLTTYDPTLLTDGAPFGFVPGVNEIHAYLAIQWLARIIDTIPAANLTSERLLDTIYQRSITIIGDQIVGPFLDDCTDILGCCNQGAHAIFVNKLVPNVMGFSDYVQIDSVTWDGCTASPENQPLPFVLGMVQDLSGQNLVVAEGIRLALTHKIAESAFNGRGAILLAYDTGTGLVLDLTTELTDIDLALGLVGQTDKLASAIVGDNVTVWSLHPDEVSDQANIIRLFPSLRDQLFAALTHALESSTTQSIQLITDNNDLVQQAMTWSDELEISLTVIAPSDTLPSEIPSAVIIYSEGVMASLIDDVANTYGQATPIYVLAVLEPQDIITALTESPIELYFTLITPAVTDPDGLVILTEYLVSNQTSQVGFTGYITGRFFARVLESINGAVNADRIFEAVYQLSVISEGGLATGRLSNQADDFCNKGLRTVYILDTQTMTTANTVTWTGCEAEFTNSTGGGGKGDGKDSVLVPVVTTVTLATVLLICCCLLIICAVCSSMILGLIVIAGIGRQRPTANSIKLTEPDYYAVAFDPDYLDSEAVKDTLLYEYDYRYKRGQLIGDLGLFEQFIINQPYAGVCIHVLEKQVDNNRKLAAWLLYIYRYQNIEEDLIQTVAKERVSNLTGVTTLFRENSFLARIFKCYCKLEGLPYLWHKFAYLVNELEIKAQGKHRTFIRMETQEMDTFSGPLEVDPIKAEDQTKGEITANVYQLKYLAQQIFNRSRQEFPAKIAGFVKIVMSAVDDRFADVADDHRRVLAASFVFLRFVCPSIMAPQQWGLLDQAPSAEAQRVLILLSKIIQNLANGQTFDKEAYMTELNDFITSNQADMSDFLDTIIESEDTFETEGLEISEVIHDSSIKHVFAAFLKHSDSVVEALEISLSAEQFAECKEEYLEPLGLTS